MKLQKILALLLATCMLGVFAACGGDEPGNGSTTTSTPPETTSQPAGSSEPSQPEVDMDAEPDLTVTHTVEIVIADYGTLTAELYGNLAPITVENFVKLAEEGFYDGLTFHRIIPGFMIQGGDPNGNGTGGSGENIKGEFASNGVPNNLAHDRGVLSMARSQKYDSASSQFFVMHAVYPSLDGDYAAFGRVTDGMEIVDKICDDAVIEDNNGKIAAENQPVIETIRVVAE